MGRRLRDVGEASSLCAPGRSKARRFASARLADGPSIWRAYGAWRLLRAF
jgi:hypothetical protein